MVPQKFASTWLPGYRLPLWEECRRDDRALGQRARLLQQNFALHYRIAAQVVAPQQWFCLPRVQQSAPSRGALRLAGQHFSLYTLIGRLLAFRAGPAVIIPEGEEGAAKFNW